MATWTNYRSLRIQLHCLRKHGDMMLVGRARMQRDGYEIPSNEP